MAPRFCVILSSRSNLWNVGDPLACSDDSERAHDKHGKVERNTSDHAPVGSLLVAADEDPPEDEVDGSEDQGQDGVNETDDEDEENDDRHLLKEILVTSLVQGEIVPFLVGEQVAVEAIAVVRIAALRRVSLEVFLVLLSILLFKLLLIEEYLSLTASSKADQEALEGNGASREQHVWIQVWQSHADVVQGHTFN